MISHLQALATQRRKLCLAEIRKKKSLEAHIKQLQADNAQFASEEERLKAENEVTQQRLAQFRHITQLELKETEEAKREISRQRSRERATARAQEEEARAKRAIPKKLVTYKEPTLTTMMKETSVKSKISSQNTIMTGKVAGTSEKN